MDVLHLHLVLNHVPVIGMIGAVFALLWGVLQRGRDVTAFALVAIVAVALIAIPVYLTGEPAEDRLEGIVAKGAVETHEEAATAAFIAIEAAALVALLTLIAWRVLRRLPVLPVAVVLVASLFAVVLVARAANLGGKIRHTELGGNTPAVMDHHEDE